MFNALTRRSGALDLETIVVEALERQCGVAGEKHCERPELVRLFPGYTYLRGTLKKCSTDFPDDAIFWRSSPAKGTHPCPLSCIRQVIAWHFSSKDKPFVWGWSDGFVTEMYKDKISSTRVDNSSLGWMGTAAGPRSIAFMCSNTFQGPRVKY